MNVPMKRTAGLVHGNFAVPSHVLKKRKLEHELKQPMHFGIILNKVKNTYMGLYSCDGRMRYVTESSNYQIVLHAVCQDAKLMRDSGHDVAENIGTEKPKPRIVGNVAPQKNAPTWQATIKKEPDENLLKPSQHFGVVLNKVRNVYTGMYICDGNMRYVTEGRFYARVLDAVKSDAQKMMKANHIVDANVGERRPAIQIKTEPDWEGEQKKPKGRNSSGGSRSKGKKMKRTWSRRKIPRQEADIPPANHWGIHCDRRKQRYLGRYTCDGKMRYVGSGVDYESVLNLVIRDAATMRQKGHNVSAKVGTLKMIRPDGHLPYPKHVGIIYDKQNKIYRGMYVCDGIERRVARGRAYHQILEAVKADVAKMRAEGREVSEWIGRPKAERRAVRHARSVARKGLKSGGSRGGPVGVAHLVEYEEAEPMESEEEPEERPAVFRQARVPPLIQHVFQEDSAEIPPLAAVRRSSDPNLDDEHAHDDLVGQWF